MQRVITRIMIFSLVLVFLMTGAAFAAVHYVLGVSSVDSSKGIEWGGKTAYSTEWSAAIATWNARGKVKISADTIWTLEDLTVSDKYDSSAPWAGRWTYNGSCCRETLELNSFYLGAYSSAKKQNTTTHELGHALGLAHSFSPNVMYGVVASVTVLGTQDISDYTYLYP